MAMNNNSVKALLDECRIELSGLETLVNGLGLTSTASPYLSKYGLIKACGTVEQAFKSIVADKCSYRARVQVKNFLTKHVRNGSANPSFENICKLLAVFDGDWKSAFKNNLNGTANAASLKTSLQSLVDARNEFAHGGNPRVAIRDVCKYFDDARKVIESLDAVVG
jgi:hypothetical protein